MGSEAVEAGLRALRHRDLSARELRLRLLGRGFAEQDCDDALETLRRTGLVDDDRFARARAAGLADRGAGDALIRQRLEAAGIGREGIDRALLDLESEETRAGRIVARRGPGQKTARYLAQKGFSSDAVRGAVAADDVEEIP